MDNIRKLLNLINLILIEIHNTIILLLTCLSIVI